MVRLCLTDAQWAKMAPHSSSDSSVCRRKATMAASSWRDRRTMERGVLGPVGRS